MYRMFAPDRSREEGPLCRAPMGTLSNAYVCHIAILLCVRDFSFVTDMPFSVSMIGFV